MCFVFNDVTMRVIDIISENVSDNSRLAGEWLKRMTILLLGAGLFYFSLLLNCDISFDTSIFLKRMFLPILFLYWRKFI